LQRGLLLGMYLRHCLLLGLQYGCRLSRSGLFQRNGGSLK
jgi:hypothetical protein